LHEEDLFLLHLTPAAHLFTKMSLASLAFFLSLVLIASARSKRQTSNVTSADIEGPYYQPGSPDRTDDGLVCYNSPAGDRLVVSGYVYNDDCSKALPNTKLDVWQANPSGEYSEGASKDSYDYNCRAVIYTDSNGYYEFRTYLPGRYDSDGYRPAHVHFKITPQSTMYTTLTTQLYFKMDTYLWPNDSCTECGSNQPSLVITLEHLKDIKTYVGEWDIVMTPSKKGSQKVIETDKKVSVNYSEKKEHIQPTKAKTITLNSQSSTVAYLAVGAICLTVGALASIGIIQIHSRIRRRSAAAV